MRVLNLCYLNVFHLKNKVPDVTLLIKSLQKQVHILGLSETRLDYKIDDKQLEINNYKINRTVLVSFFKALILRSSSLFCHNRQGPISLQQAFHSSGPAD